LSFFDMIFTAAAIAVSDSLRNLVTIT
jgi:hypothetical protein